MPSAGKLQGIFTPNIVPLDARGEINEPELRRYTDPEHVTYGSDSYAPLSFDRP